MAENNQTPINEEEYEPDLVTLEDEEGKEHTFEVIDSADYKDNHYVALVPYVETEDDLIEQNLDLILMRVGEDAEGEYMDLIDDEAEMQEVSAMFEQRLSEFFEIQQ